MKYIFYIISILCFFSCSKNKGKAVSDENINLSKESPYLIKAQPSEPSNIKFSLIQSIKQVCLDPVFSDSLLIAWNAASALYIEKEIKEKEDSACWNNTLLSFKKVDFSIRICKDDKQ